MLSFLGVVRTFATTAAAAMVAGGRPDTTDYRRLFLSDAPMMDVRAPVEFDKGSFPSAVNVPLLTDEERHKVGICYKEHGQAAAIQLGHELVNGEVKAARLKQWTDFCQSHPNNGYLYCFRGGVRSHGVQQWIKEESSGSTINCNYPLVTGGYKAMRTFLMDELEVSMSTTDHDHPQAAELVVVCGKTGAGKTLVIEQLAHSKCSLDLEGLAHHRGSSFGALPADPDQPSQIDFENSISIALLKLLDPHARANANANANVNVAAKSNNNNQNQQNKHESSTFSSLLKPPRIFVEDEGNRIGRVTLPLPLRNRMDACDGIVVVEGSVEDRAEVILKDYVIDLRERFIAFHGIEHGLDLHRAFCFAALKRIRNRLGGDRHQRMEATMEAAFQEEQSSGDMTLFRVWISELLVEYYDKMYDYQLAQRKDKVLFRGSRDEVVEWALSTAVAVE
jgi:tRNA 2-selenouridine synthase